MNINTISKIINELREADSQIAIHNDIRNKLSNKVFELLIQYISSNNRVCPMPPQWDGLYQLLPKNTDHSDVGDLTPFVFDSWWNTSDKEKQTRLIRQIKWASSENAIISIAEYIINIQDGEWSYLDD